MRTIYLIRHCEPDFPDGKRVCLSGGDISLSRLGRMQAVLLRESLPHVDHVFCSPLARARETALALAPEVEARENLRELGMGDWEGLSFAEIRARYPKLYGERGKKPFICFPSGAEKPVDCLTRMGYELDSLCQRIQGDFAVVAHAGVNRLFLCEALKKDRNDFLKLPQPYGCVNMICENGQNLTVWGTGMQPRPVLSPELCINLMSAAGTPKPVQEHSCAVAVLADEIGQSLIKQGYPLNLYLLHSAALLHDIARTEPQHPKAGSDWLSALGYPEVGIVIAAHHDLPDEQDLEINESVILYLADKLTQGAIHVTLEERFALSAKKCASERAKKAHSQRYQQAKRVENMIKKAIGTVGEL